MLTLQGVVQTGQIYKTLLTHQKHAIRIINKKHFPVIRNSKCFQVNVFKLNVLDITIFRCYNEGKIVWQLFRRARWKIWC